MTTIDIKNLLPEPNGSAYDKIKAELPYNILLKYAKAIDEKYNGKISAIVTETSSNKNVIECAFYICAKIGNGYSYRFLEISPTTAEIYPVSMTIFENDNPLKLSKITNNEQLEESLQGFFQRRFFQGLILSLLAHINSSNQE